MAALTAMAAEVHAVDPALLEAASFTEADLNALLNGQREGKNDPDAVPEPPAEPVTVARDVWVLGPHRIICGDCRDHGTVERLLDGAAVNVAFTSPPYASQRAYDESSGFRPIPPDEYADWFEDVQANVRAHLAGDGSWFVNIKEHAQDGQRHLYVKELAIAHARRWCWRFIDEFAWVTNGLPGRFDERFKNRFEPVFHFAGPEKIKFRPYEVAYMSERTTRYRPEQGFSMKQASGYTQGLPHVEEEGLALPGNVLEIATEGRGSGVGMGHTAAFPVALPQWFIRAYSDPGDTVFDPFMGSGSTLIAAHREQRTAYGCEISPAYCDVICRRYQEHTGTKPVLEATGQPHDFT
jgi:site-specific DNA-methyltransferase (adenine-specific)/site-specific DNA-methyltransferase (cytosine-N4-specific)